MYLCQIASVPFIFSWQLIGHLAQDECPKQIQTESRWGPRDLSVEERGEEGVASKPEQKQTRTRCYQPLPPPGDTRERERFHS